MYSIVANDCEICEFLLKKIENVRYIKQLIYNYIKLTVPTIKFYSILVPHRLQKWYPCP